VNRSILLAASLIVGASAASCRGGVSEDPPINLAPDMDLQAHRRPQSPSKIFADGRAGRRPVEHTVSRGHLKTDPAMYQGVDANGKPLARIPFEVTPETLERGEERFNIYCAPCHDKTGSGNGAVPRRLQGTSDQAAFADIPSYALARLKNEPDGEIFRTITTGLPAGAVSSRMPAYAAQIPEQDRWAIVAWVRVLQNILPPASAPTPAPAPSGSTAPKQGGAK
jgi:mono/diheme cytochrome c family protein